MVTLDVAVFAGAELSVTVRWRCSYTPSCRCGLGSAEVAAADPSPKFQLYE